MILIINLSTKFSTPQVFSTVVFGINKTQGRLM